MFDPMAWGPEVAALLPPRPVSLGPGRTDREQLSRLDTVTPESLFPRPLRDPQMAASCLSGLYLYHDALDFSHSLSQAIKTPEGSFWHGIMHRREPDYPNSKYWFRLVERHAIFPSLAAAAAELAGQFEDAPHFLHDAAEWNPFSFIDMVADVIDTDSPHEHLARAIQAEEWRLLFDWCWRHAV